MNQTGMSTEFTEAFKPKLVNHVTQTRSRHPRRRELWSACVAVAVVLGGTAAAAASGLLVLPGGTEVTPMAAAKTMSDTGTGSLDLGPVPAEATGVTLSFTCLTAGLFTFDDGADVECTTADAGASTSTYVLALEFVKGTQVTIITTPDARWNLTASYVTEETTSWGVNDAGQTYGVVNEQGEPDLIAVIATNTQPGYVLRTDLEDADGTTAMREFTSPEDALRWQEENAGVIHRIPVYENDGSTLIGEFEIVNG